MRKAEAIATITGLNRRIAALEARLAKYEPKPKSVSPVTVEPAEPTPPKAEVKAEVVVAPAKRSKSKKADAEGKADDDETLLYAARSENGPMAQMSSAELAAEYGSPGYDDLVTPIHDHDRDWKATSKVVKYPIRK